MVKKDDFLDEILKKLSPALKARLKFTLKIF